MSDIESKFSELPPAVQKFLKDLREEDIKLLEEAIKLVRSLLTVGRFAKWSILTIVGFFVGAAMLGDAFMSLKAMIGKVLK